MKKQKAGVKTGLKSKQSIKNWQNLETVPQSGAGIQRRDCHEQIKVVQKGESFELGTRLRVTCIALAATSQKLEGKKVQFLSRRSVSALNPLSFVHKTYNQRQLSISYTFSQEILGYQSFLSLPSEETNITGQDLDAHPTRRI